MYPNRGRLDVSPCHQERDLILRPSQRYLALRAANLLHIAVDISFAATLAEGCVSRLKGNKRHRGGFSRMSPCTWRVSANRTCPPEREEQARHENAGSQKAT